ncbi:MAG: flagellar motor switch protein FliM [Spirochaetales bacterium]|nr:flagellar motor switch protein FliM [Spirochaetales bacterium]
MSDKETKTDEIFPEVDGLYVIGTWKAKDIVASNHAADREIKVKKYDFRRPDKFSRDQLRTLSIIHESFARSSTILLSGMCKTDCHIKVGSVDQMTYDEAIRSTPAPSTLGIINMDPLKGSALLQMDPDLSSAFIELLAGGRSATPVSQQKDLTDCESGIIEEVYLRLLKNLRDAWSTVLDLHPRLGALDTNPAFCQIVPPHEMIVLVTFQCIIGDARGFMNFCIPFLTIEPIIYKLNAQYWYSSPRREMYKEELDKNLAWTTRFKVPAALYYSTDDISLQRLQELKKGSLVAISGLDAGTACLECGNQTVLPLVPKKTGKHNEFIVSNIWDETIADFEHADEKSEQKDTAASDEVLFRFGKTIKESMQKIENKLSELSARQTELTDQLFFGTAQNNIEEPVQTSQPLQFAAQIERELLANFLVHEHPQIIALVLSHIDPLVAAGVLPFIPKEFQADIAVRIAEIKPVALNVIEAVSRVIKRRFETAKATAMEFEGGPGHLAEMLKTMPKKTEEYLLDAMTKSNPVMLQEVVKNMSEKTKGS